MKQRREVAATVLVSMLGICISSSFLFSFSLLGNRGFIVSGLTSTLLAISALFGAPIAAGSLFLRGAMRSMLGLGLSYVSFFNGLPTLIGALAIHQPSMVLFLVVGGAGAFWLHPVGAAAYLYPFLWLIPLLALLGKSMFARMIIGSFSAHIVGSLLWLYLGLLHSPAAWTALIPCVLIERLGVAIVAWALYMLHRVFWQRLCGVRNQREPLYRAQ
ncbi:MAG: hypothetical protein UV79_C0019G0005 [candidate division TM6 bacterium GW2011_GWF2_43_17]|nr:MAG: hypothetical protein UV79_C0019G0005 [candidate division TM6 bacterium GW2011_GWF2_43_17]HAU30226.1 hypothetical protein [Candidatus Dependentiae bacterium]